MTSLSSKAILIPKILILAIILFLAAMGIRENFWIGMTILILFPIVFTFIQFLQNDYFLMMHENEFINIYFLFYFEKISIDSKLNLITKRNSFTIIDKEGNELEVRDWLYYASFWIPLNLNKRRENLLRKIENHIKANKLHIELIAPLEKEERT